MASPGSQFRLRRSYRCALWFPSCCGRSVCVLPGVKAACAQDPWARTIQTEKPTQSKTANSTKSASTRFSHSRALSACAGFGPVLAAGRWKNSSGSLTLKRSSRVFCDVDPATWVRGGRPCPWACVEGACRAAGLLSTTLAFCGVASSCQFEGNCMFWSVKSSIGVPRFVRPLALLFPVRFCPAGMVAL